MAKTKGKDKNWGGAREGSGPKREVLSVRQVKEMRAKMKERAKATGKDENDILIDFIQAVDGEGDAVKIALRDRIACIKLWKDYTSPKITEGGEADKTILPAVFLPSKHPRLELVNDGSSASDK